MAEQRRDYVCLFCCKVFPKEVFLQKHSQSVHDVERPYNCVCGKKFFTANQLEKHSTAHAGYHAFPSPFNTLKFRAHKLLEQHIDKYCTDGKLTKRLVTNASGGTANKVAIGFEVLTKGLHAELQPTPMKRKNDAGTEARSGQKRTSKALSDALEADESDIDTGDEKSGPGIYHVDRLLQKRQKNGKDEYLVKWANCGPEENTWEPAAHITADLLRIFNQRNAKSGKTTKSGQD